jgi:hypothetical protein
MWSGKISKELEQQLAGNMEQNLDSYLEKTTEAIKGLTLENALAVLDVLREDLLKQAAINLEEVTEVKAKLKTLLEKHGR